MRLNVVFILVFVKSDLAFRETQYSICSSPN